MAETASADFAETRTSIKRRLKSSCHDARGVELQPEHLPVRLSGKNLRLGLNTNIA
jgi:hypothetical protein